MQLTPNDSTKFLSGTGGSSQWNMFDNGSGVIIFNASTGSFAFVSNGNIGATVATNNSDCAIHLVSNVNSTFMEFGIRGSISGDAFINTTGTLTNTLDIGDGEGNYGNLNTGPTTVFGDLDVQGNLTIGQTLIDGVGSSGTAGQLLSSTSTATQWVSGVATLAIKTGVNAKTIANTALYTVPTGRTAVVTDAIVRVTAQSGLISAGPIGGIGNSAGTNNIFASQSTGLTTVNSTYSFIDSGASVVTTAGGVIYFNLGTGATGTGSETIAIDLIGYLI